MLRLISICSIIWLVLANAYVLLAQGVVEKDEYVDGFLSNRLNASFYACAMYFELFDENTKNLDASELETGWLLRLIDSKNGRLRQDELTQTIQGDQSLSHVPIAFISSSEEAVQIIGNFHRSSVRMPLSDKEPLKGFVEQCSCDPFMCAFSGRVSFEKKPINNMLNRLETGPLNRCNLQTSVDENESIINEYQISEKYQIYDRIVFGHKFGNMPLHIDRGRMIDGKLQVFEKIDTKWTSFGKVWYPRRTLIEQTSGDAKKPEMKRTGEVTYYWMFDGLTKRMWEYTDQGPVIFGTELRDLIQTNARTAQ